MTTSSVPARETTRKRFLAYFSAAGLGSTLLPGALWAEMSRQQAAAVSGEMVRDAGWVAGLELTEEQAEEMAEGVN
ncbi:MAG: hypothetical protein HKO53_16355, partial [Gemmatimonadetes bacterium]|nr:hypothetical protein [Gemmatimonadota bacterium]